MWKLLVSKTPTCLCIKGVQSLNNRKKKMATLSWFYPQWLCKLMWILADCMQIRWFWAAYKQAVWKTRVRFEEDKLCSWAHMLREGVEYNLKLKEYSDVKRWCKLGRQWKEVLFIYLKQIFKSFNHWQPCLINKYCYPFSLLLKFFNLLNTVNLKKK